MGWSWQTAVGVLAAAWWARQVVDARQMVPSTQHQRLSPVMVDVARRLLEDELSGCSLTVIGGGREAAKDFTHLAANMGVLYQVSPGELRLENPPNITWSGGVCDAFFVMVEQEGASGSVREYLEARGAPWHFRGKYVFFSAGGRNNLKVLATSHVLRKTVDVLFVWPGERGEDQAEIWTHWIYSHQTLRFLAFASPLGFVKYGELFPRKLADLRGFPLVVKTFLFAPSVFGELEEDGRSIRATGGQDVSFILLLARYLNFTVQWQHPGPLLWGELLDNGTYTGLVGQVSEGEGDLGVANIFLDLQRSWYIRFTYPYTYELACFITPAPRELPRWMALGFPFTLVVWLALATTLVAVGLLYPVLARLLPSSRDHAEFYSWGLSFVFTLGAFTCRSMRLPATDRLRVASLTLLFMGFVIAITFSGNLTAFMTTRSVEAAIRTLSELGRSHLTIVGFGNYWPIAFAGSENPSIRSLTDKYKSVYNTLPYFREAAEQRQVALIENRNHLEFIQRRRYTTRRGESPLRIQEECLATYGVGAVLSRHSPLAPYVDKAIHHMQAGGLTDKFFREVLTQGLDDSHQQQGDGEASWLDLHDQILIPSGPQVLTVEHVQGAFIVLAVGYLAASLSLVGEVMMVADLCLTASTPA